VAQSLDGSLEQLRTECVDSFVLHGPSSGYGWSEVDSEAWAAMLRERDAGRARLVGVSNVSILHLEQMAGTGMELPWCVQNRCYARFQWDRGIRKFCKKHGIVYQGFSLLTANGDIVAHPVVAGIATRHGVTPAQVVFRFAQIIGILPLTGTSNSDHMKQDLLSSGVALTSDEVATIEGLR
jgi:diketogulonate reductase-like aldo/keto reductase